MARVLLIAADPELRRSLQFAFEAEGYAVSWRTRLGSDVRPQDFDCTVIDDDGLGVDKAAAVAFFETFTPVVLLADTVPHSLSPWAFLTVEKPMLGAALARAVQQAVATRRITT